MYIGEESGCQLVPEPCRVMGRFLENELRMSIIMPPLLSVAIPAMPGIPAISAFPGAAVSMFMPGMSRARLRAWSAIPGIAAGAGDAAGLPGVVAGAGMLMPGISIPGMAGGGRRFRAGWYRPERRRGDGMPGPRLFWGVAQERKHL